MPEITTSSSPNQLTKTLKNFCFQTLLAKDFTKDKLSKLIVNKLDYKKSSLNNNSREDLMNIISNHLDQFCVHDLLNCCNSIICLSAISLYRFQFLTNFDGSKELTLVDLNDKKLVENESENGSDEMNQLISGLQIGGEPEKNEIFESNNQNEEQQIQQKSQEENQITNLKSLSPPKFYINKNRDQTDIQQEFKEFIQKTYLPWFEKLPVTSNTDVLKFNYLSQCFNNFQNQTKVQQIIDANAKKSNNFEACVDKICKIFPVSRPVSVTKNGSNTMVDNNGWIKFEQSRPSETESKLTLESTPIKIKSPKLSVVIRSKKGDDSDRTSNNSSSDKKSVNNDDEIDKENIQPENLSAKEPLCPKFSSQRNNRSFLKDNKGSMDSFKTSDSKSVYVSNLEYSVSKDMLTNYFEKVGPI